MEQKPSLGRIVIVGGDDDGEERAAIVTAVHSDTCINVTRFNEQGDTTGLTSLTLPDPNQSLGNCNWRWPTRN